MSSSATRAETSPSTTPHVLTLKGGQNFREVGGLPTRDGRRMRRGMIWRSAMLDQLNDEDVKTIAGLGLRAIADLRQHHERSQNPTHPAILDGVKLLVWDAAQRPQRDYTHMLDPRRTRADYIAFVHEFYARLPDEHATQLRDTYLAIADGDAPLLVHCAAGKDRTGIAVAILLELLGVPRDLVVADYALTETILDWRRLTTRAAGAGASVEFMDRLPEHGLEIALRSDPAYLMTALTTLEQRHGTIEAFARERLDLSDATLSRLRTTLLEPASA